MTTSTEIDGCYRRTNAATRPDGTVVETFLPSTHSGSPWGPGIQHGGPVAGLLARAIERCAPRPGTRISRLTVEILGPVPMSELATHARVERPGKRIELLSAELTTTLADGTSRPVARAHAWRLATAPTADVHHYADPPLAFPGDIHASDGDGSDAVPLPTAWRVGFVNALRWRGVSPMGVRNTPSSAWLRLAVPLVEDETSSALVHTAAVADVANGLGARLDPRRWTFLNTEMTLHLFEPPSGNWIGLECETSIGHDGIAMSAAVIHGPTGPVGRATQTVLVEKRPETVEL